MRTYTPNEKNVYIIVSALLYVSVDAIKKAKDDLLSLEYDMDSQQRTDAIEAFNKVLAIYDL